MYLNHFNLSKRPFSITPDPRFLFMSARHREALAHLLYGLGEGGGFVQLTGEVGTGKTTMCRCLLEQVPENVDIALVLNPKVTAEELIATVCDELDVEYPSEIHSIKTLTDVLNRYLLDAHSRGRRTVLIIDEAQNLSAEVLEQVRLLTNLETATQKLLQIILIGQPELRTLLAREEMRQLAQRVTARYHLEPIPPRDVEAYIQHRLQICGTSHNIFNKGAIESIRRLSGGIPRLINVLCDRALLGAYVEGQSHVDKKIVKTAAREILAEDAEESGGWRWFPVAAGGMAVIALAVTALYYQPWRQMDIRAAGPEKTAKVTVADVPTRRVLARSATPKPAPMLKPEPKPELAPQPAPKQVSPDGAAGEPKEFQSGDIGPERESLESLLLAADGSYFRQAWTALFAQWSIVLPAAVKPDFCNFAVENGLRCLYEKGTWNSLRHFDRPVILKLASEDGERVPVVLSHLDDQVAELVVGNALHRLPVEEVDRYWFGNYVMLMQTPPSGSMFMKVGRRWPDVKWLREQIEVIQGVELAADDPLYFDDGLYQEILAFQRSRGLVSDGIVGKHTIIHLNSQSRQPGIPRLAMGAS